ncbi:MAG: YbaN family protein [Rhodoferax sp.]
MRENPPRRTAWHRHLVLLAWRALALLCVVLAGIGVVLPGLPTVPFLLVAAWAGGHGWPRLERWLLAHPRLGPPIHRWRAHGAVPRRAKWFASGMMVVSTVVIALSAAPLAAKLGVPGVMLATAIWLWRRPER